MLNIQRPETFPPEDQILPFGVNELNLRAGARDGLLFVPKASSKTSPSTLLLMFHGALQSAKIGEHSVGEIVEIVKVTLFD
jgi:hypothetical protein